MQFLFKINAVFIYYILNWFNKILHMLDILSNIWAEFINNESIVADLRIWVLSQFFIFFFKTKRAKNLEKYTVKINTILHTSQ